MTERIWGYELSDIEKSLIFEKENTGYVRWRNKKLGVAYLDPSPFKKTTKFEYYVFLGQLPEEGTLVEVEVDSTKKIFDKDSSGVLREYTLKYVTKWKEIDPFQIIKHKPLMDKEDLREALLLPFKDKDYVIADSIAFYMASSPSQVEDKGGIIAGCLVGRKKVWNNFKTRFASIIPPEFRSPQSKYYYDFFDQDLAINPKNMRSEEINLDFRNPVDAHIHIPQPLINAEFKRVRDYETLLRDVKPLIRAMMYQMVLLQPIPKRSAERVLLDKIYEIRDKLHQRGIIPFKPDMTFIRRIVMALSRLELEKEILPQKVDIATEFWLDAYEQSLKLTSSGVDFNEFFRLSSIAKKLYTIFIEIGREVSEAEIYQEGLKNNLNEIEIEAALDELLKKALIVRPSHGMYVLVEL